MGKWEMVRLGDVCSFKSGKSLNDEFLSNDGIPYVKVAELNLKENIPCITTSIRFVNFDFDEKQIIPSGSVVFPKRGGAIGTNKKRITACPIVADLNIMAVIPSSRLLSSYLYFYFQRIDMGSLGNGSSVPQINNGDIFPLQIPLPPLDEQKRMAKNLDLASEIVKGYKEQLAELDKLVQSVFYEMFGDPVTNEKGWDNRKLGSLCDISRGGSPRPIEKFLGGTIPWIKIGDATKGENIYLNATKDHILESGIKKSRLIKAGGLIFANCGVSLGFARIITFNGCIHDGWLAFEQISAHLDKIFLLKSLNFCTEHFRRIAPDGTQPNLNTSIMKNYFQILPPLPLQARFAEIVTAIEAQKAQVQRALAEAENLFNSLMQEYFA